MVNAPEPPEETVEVVRLASDERVHQRTVQQVVDEPQSPPETIEVVRVALIATATR